MAKKELTLRNCAFAFECKANWDDLTKIPDKKDVRFCSDCQKKVCYCKSDSALNKHVRLNHCVAIDAELYKAWYEIKPDDHKHILVGDICPSTYNK